jgi:beta-hydroxylase
LDGTAMRLGDYLLGPTRIALGLVAVSAAAVHFRGKARLRFTRQLTDHSTFTAPYNTLVYLASRAPHRPFLDPDDFPDLKPLAENWQVFRDEGLRLMGEGKVRAATGDNDLGFHSFFKQGWKRFYLKWYDHPLPSAEALCPRSAALLKTAPSVRGAMFATLPPKAYLGRHRDPFAGALRYHLGLRTPNHPKCWIMVDGERRAWADGEPMLFDETFVHEAWNGTDVTRLILLCDIERPLRSPMRPINRWVMRYLMSATGSPNEAGERIGAINRLYGRLAGVQKAIKDLKAKNRPLYEAQKWATILAALGLLLAPY